MIRKEHFMNKKKMVVSGLVFTFLVGLSFVYKYFKEREVYNCDDVMYAFIDG